MATICVISPSSQKRKREETLLRRATRKRYRETEDTDEDGDIIMTDFQERKVQMLKNGVGDVKIYVHRAF